MAKETIYIDADEEITAVIEKVTSAKEKVIALVLPKKATLFQSTVNAKLLKKAAKQANKNLVLISSDPALESVAAVAGVHVATSLSSKPAIPKRKLVEETTTIDSYEIDGLAADASPISDDEPVDMTLDDEPPIEMSSLEQAAESTAKKKKFKIPDFRSFKVKMAIAITLLLLVVVGWVFAFIILPKAIITIETDTQRIDISTQFRVDTDQQEIDIENSILPATLVEVSNKDTATVDATGSKDIGENATGTLTLTNCRQGAAGVTIPAGAGFSAGGKTYSTNAAVQLGPAVYVGDECISGDFPAFGAVADVGVTANEPGDSYNNSAQAFESPTNGVTAFGSDMSGGTSKVVTVVSSDDIKKAEEQLVGAATAEAIAELQSTLQAEALMALDETLRESDAVTSNSEDAGDEADEVTVTRTVTFSMLGVKAEDLSNLINRKIEEEINDSSRNIRDNGLEGMTLQLITADNDSDQTLQLQTVATIGQLFNEDSIKQEAAGKTRGEVESLFESRDGVREVRIKYEPFWITTTPDSTDKITIIVNEAE